jgi:hypothetical protein
MGRSLSCRDTGLISIYLAFRKEILMNYMYHFFQMTISLIGYSGWVKLVSKLESCHTRSNRWLSKLAKSLERFCP